MPVSVNRKNIIFQPDSSRVIARLLSNSDQRSIALIKKVLDLPEKQQRETLVPGFKGLFKKAPEYFKNF